MKNKLKIWTSVMSAIGIIILVLDTKTALLGAEEGISLCLQTVIPSLFPFLVLCIFLNNSVNYGMFRFLRPVSRICAIPDGGESLLGIGFIGGYPIGAQNVYLAYKNRSIDNEDARRLLGFCSNAGPAFIFGMIGSLFDSKIMTTSIWLIQIISAIVVGVLLPRRERKTCNIDVNNPIRFSDALKISLNSLALICGWIIIFRIFITFLRRWFLWLLPVWLQTVIIGIFELSNGCLELNAIANTSLRFIICNVILAFGGFSVMMQTKSVTKELGLGFYFPGKVLQAIISVVLSIIWLLII